MTKSKFIMTLIASVAVSSCQNIDTSTPTLPIATSNGHISQDAIHSDVQDIPKLLTATPSLPTPQPQKKEPVFTVIVNNVPVHELLFSLARDTKVNLDIDQDVQGFITLNAIDQPLNAILDRISKSSNLIYSYENNVLHIQKDKPFLKNYRIDYINMSRGAQSNVAVSTQINSTGQGAGNASSAIGSGGDNNSSTLVTNSSTNSFWETLQLNIAAILYRKTESDEKTSLLEAKSDIPASEPSATATSGESGNPNIILNKESGILGVRATQKQHQEIERFINEVQFSTQRQVLIEATIAEVKLSDRYQAGIDWNMLSGQLGETFNIKQQMSDIALFNRPAFTLQTNNDKGNGESIQGTLSALESFGDVKIMSSPKIMALNNQTALLKVVDNIVYFTVDVRIESAAGAVPGGSTVAFATYETEVNTVPVGFVMSVTPYISESDSVTLNVRPTISRVIRQARDPNPSLAQAGVISEIPVIQVREVESVLKVASGDIAVMGGLMQDEINKDQRGVPFLSRLPFLGALFRYDNNLTEKTELVIFIRPLVVKHASVSADLRTFNSFLPTSPN